MWHPKSMDGQAPEVIATVTAERFGDAYGAIISANMREDLQRRIQAAIAEALRGQQQAHVRLCLARQALWEKTEGRPETPEILRAEARGRANEAAYLADVIETAGTPLRAGS
jgi:hypothetical protein